MIEAYEEPHGAQLDPSQFNWAHLLKGRFRYLFTPKHDLQERYYEESKSEDDFSTADADKEKNAMAAMYTDASRVTQLEKGVGAAKDKAKRGFSRLTRLGAAAVVKGSEAIAKGKEALELKLAEFTKVEDEEPEDDDSDEGGSTPRWARESGMKLLLVGDIELEGLEPEPRKYKHCFKRPDVLAKIVAFLNPRSCGLAAQAAKKWADACYAEPLYYDVLQFGGAHHLLLDTGSYRIDALVCTPTGGALLASTNRKVLAYSTETGNLLAETKVRDTTHIPALFITAGTLWSGSANGAIREYSLPHNVKNVEFRTQLWDHNARVNDLCNADRAPDFGGQAAATDLGGLVLKERKDRLISCSDDRKIFIWDLETRSIEAVLRPHSHTSATMRCVHVSTDHLYIGTSDGLVYVHAVNGVSRNRRQKKAVGVAAIYPLEKELENGNAVLSVIRSGSQRGGRDDTLFVASWDGSLRLWGIPLSGLNFELLYTFQDHIDRITSVVVTPYHLITAGDDSVIRLYGLYHGEYYEDYLERVVPTASRVKKLEIAPPTAESSSYLCCGLSNGQIQVFVFGLYL